LLKPKNENRQKKKREDYEGGGTVVGGERNASPNGKAVIKGGSTICQKNGVIGEGS